MSALFSCPSCNASLDYEEDDAPVVQCAYCNSTVVVPEHIQGKANETFQGEWTTFFSDSPLVFDLSGLTGKTITLKAVKTLIRQGEKAEAARVYQDSFKASSAEAQAFVESLATGHSVMFTSSTTFSSDVQVVSGTEVHVVAEQQTMPDWLQQTPTEQQKPSSNQRLTCFVTFMIFSILMLSSMIVFLALSMR